MAGTTNDDSGHAHDPGGQPPPVLPPPTPHAPTLPQAPALPPSAPPPPTSAPSVAPGVVARPDHFGSTVVAARAQQRHQRRSARTFWVVLGAAAVGAAAVAVVALRERSGSDLAVDSTATTDAPVATAVIPTTAPAPTTPPPTAAPLQLYMVGQPVPPARPVTTDPDARRFDFTIRRYDTAEPDSPAIEHRYVYDAVDDVGTVYTTSDGQPNFTFTMFGPTYRTVSYPDGALERIPRSAASLSPEPDIWLARPLGQDDIIPPSSQPFTSVVSVAKREVGGRPATVVAVHVDVVAYAAQFPEEHAEWVWRWASQTPFDPVLVDVDGRQLAVDPPPRDDEPDAPQRLPWLEVAMEVEVAVVMYAVNPDGLVQLAAIADPIAGYRSLYAALPPSEHPLEVRETGTFTWVDAPA